MFSRFNHVVTNFRTYFIFKAEKYPIFFIHLLTDTKIVSYLATINAAKNMGV